MDRPKVTHIVAHDLNNCIGSGGKLPWHLPQDLAWFNRNTMGKALLFGRKTKEGLPKINWGDRRVYVASRKGMYPNNLKDFIDDPHVITWDSENKSEVMVCGGQQIYEQTLAIADELLITVVFTEVVGDAYYPPYKDQFKLEWESEVQEQNGLAFQFTRWVRA